MNAADDKQLARFEALVNAADRGRLGFAELRELARLYRVQSARLALQRTRANDPEALRYFNALCLRAYTHVYAVPPHARGRAFFWVRELPAALGRTARMQLLASALLAIGALLGARLALEDGANLAAIVPAGMYPESALHQLWNSEAARREFLAPRDEKFSIDTIFAGSLFANNTRVGLLSLASGVLAAAPTALLLLYNGLTLGGFGAIFMRGPEWLQFLAWIVPHAIPELLAIVLCSAGGLSIGLAVIVPGRDGRGVALRRAGSDALLLFAASVPLLVVAALIESFVRQSMMTSVERFAVATLALLTLWSYVRIARHYARAQGPDLQFLAAPTSTTHPTRQA